MKILKTFPVRVKHYTRRMAEAECPSCGCVVIRQYSNAVRQETCGCQRKVLRGSAHYHFKHGKKPIKLYGVWMSMRERCRNKNNMRFARYGGRGIRVCSEWNQFATFRTWALKNGWRSGLQIDRKDNDGHYEPGNCRFVTSAINNRNRSSSKLNNAMADGIRGLLAEGVCGAEVARTYGVSVTMVYKIRDGKSWV